MHKAPPDPHDLIQLHPGLFFVFFIGMWMAGSILVGVLSGWYRLMANYPDRLEQPILQLRGLSGRMGLGLAMNRILTLAACSAGLRVGMNRLFGPFCRPFFVPWDQLKVIRQHRLWGAEAQLQFGPVMLGSLTIPARVADQLARAADHHWPEPGPLIEETPRDTGRRVFKTWALRTGLAALFFTLVPMLFAPAAAHPPALVAVFFPAFVFGIAAVFDYARER